MPGAAWPWKYTWSPIAAGEVLAAEEVVEADLVQRRGRRVRGDVAADADGLVRSGHHDRRVPSDVGPDPALDVLVAREPWLAFRRDRVDVVRAAQRGHADLASARTLQQLEHEEPSPLTAIGVDGRVERLQPLPGLVRIDVR